MRDLDFFKLLKLALIWFFFVVTSYSCRTPLENQPEDLKMVGGYALEQDKYPCTVIIITPLGQCTGAVVSKRHILTAAHCFTGSSAGNYLARENLRIGLTNKKEYDPRTDLPFVPVSKIHISETWSQLPNHDHSANVYAFDAAIIELGEDIVGIPAGKISYEPVKPGAKVTLVGAGCEGDREGSQSKLSRIRGGDATVITNDEAFALFDKNNTNIEFKKSVLETTRYFFTPGFQFNAKPTASLCLGDSGGPDFAEISGTDYIVGINSFKHSRLHAESNFQGSSRLDSMNGHAKWIQNILRYVPEWNAADN